MKLIFEYIKKYKATYIGVVIIFIIGLFIGAIISFRTSENERDEIKNYISESIQNLEIYKDNKQEIFISTFTQNMKFIFITWLLGCTIIAGFTIYILMLYKGFLIGYIIFIVLNIFGINQGFKFLNILLILQNIIILPMLFLLATSGIRLYKEIIKKENDIKYEIIRHSVIGFLCVGAVIISSCVEAYFAVLFL